MSDNGNKIHFKLDTPPEQSERMTAELESAPTYKFKVESSGAERRIVSASQAHRDRDGITTDTAIASRSLNRKLASYSLEQPDEAKNRYTRKSVLGEGGTGVVYEMTDNNVGRDVAVKILKEAKSQSERRSFIEEGQLAAKLEHPNIIPIYDMDVDDRGQVFLTMKKVQGSTMKSYIDGETNLDLEEILIIFNKVCDALEYAHSLDKIHQDIKPENIMIGDYGEVFIIDWGAATSNSEDMQISPVYMSPEQARGEMPSITDDVYCLGASLFHVLTKRFPTNAKTIDELWDKKVKGLIDMPTVRERRTIPRPLLAIALKAMKADIYQRYQTVEELADDLRAYLSGFPTTAENAGIITQLELLIKRRFREATILLVAILTLGGVGGLYHFLIHTKEAELVKAQLLTYQLEEERKEHWLSVLDQDFTLGKEIDPRLNVTPDLIEDGGVYLHFQSAFSKIDIDEPLNSDPRVEVRFTCDNIPSLMIGFASREESDSRVFRVRDGIEMLDYNHGFSSPYVSTKLCADYLRFDQVNTLTCWRRNNTWHASLNGESFVEFYDSNLSAGTSGTKLSIGRQVPLGVVKIVSIKVWNRRPANYVSILDRGRQYRLLGEYKKARALFLDQARYQENKDIVNEARFLAAISDGGQSEEQRIDELTSIANDTNSVYRHRAMHLLAVAAAKGDDWDKTLDLLEQLTVEAPELNTYHSVWPLISPRIKRMPNSQKEETLARLFELPARGRSLSNFNLRDLSFVTKPISGELTIAGNPITDLTPLRGSTFDYLDIGKTAVTDLSPLRGQNLRRFSASELILTDLSPLEGMTFDMLLLKRHESLDLSTLKDVKVVKLILDNSRIRTPSAITATNARILRIRGCELSNLDFVKGMQPVSVHASENEITNLDGLKGQEVTDLQLNMNLISDIGALRTVKVTRGLGLHRNPVSDISPLKGKMFKSLNINETLVTDLTPLRTMPNLEYLNISGPSPSIEPHVKTWHSTPELKTIGPLELKSLILANANLESIEPLKSCRISGLLDLSNNPIADLSALSNQDVKTLNISNTDVMDLTPLQSLENLQSLDVSISLPGKKGKVTSLKGLAGLKIDSLNLSGQQVSDLSQLRELPKLSTLVVSGTFSDLSPLKGLPLHTVIVEEAQVTDLSVFRSLKKIRNLTITGDETTPGLLDDLVPLAGREFNNLILTSNSIEDINPLGNCRITGVLSLSRNPVKDISALEGQPLWYLDISHTGVTDITVISTLKHLRRLKIIGLELDEKSRKLVETLPFMVISEEEEY